MRREEGSVFPILKASVDPAEKLREFPSGFFLLIGKAIRCSGENKNEEFLCVQLALL